MRVRALTCAFFRFCIQDLESSPATASYSKNGSSLGTAHTLEGLSSDFAFFPCVSTKNVAFSVNFGGVSAWFEVEGVEGYSFVQAVTEEHRVAAPQVLVPFHH